MNQISPMWCLPDMFAYSSHNLSASSAKGSCSLTIFCSTPALENANQFDAKYFGGKKSCMGNARTQYFL